MRVDIVSMSISDYDGVANLWESVEGVGLHDFEDSREGIALYLDRNPGMSFVARENGAIVAAVLCGHDGRRGSINHLAVSPEYRRQGIGKALADRCLYELRSAGIRKCNILVLQENASGRGFWSRLGWNVREDLLHMQHLTVVEAEE